MDEFSTFGDEDVTDEAVGGSFGEGSSHSTPIENGAKFLEDEVDRMNKAVNHGAKKQWSWAPSSGLILRLLGTQFRAIKKYFDVYEFE